jgi:hypothetical protein
MYVVSTPPGPRSVKIDNDERGAWSSDRPRREGGPPRQADLSVRSRVLRPADRMRYSPGSLVVVVSGSAEERDRFIGRAFEDRGAVLTLARVRALLAGRVAEEEAEERAAQLLDAAVLKRLEEHASVVVGVDGVEPEDREPFVRMAASVGRPRHLILLEVARDRVREEDRATLNDLRRRLDAGELGAEGFQTVLRLGGATASDVKRILFRPPPQDD